jgi:UDP-3-O-[3-hydroxymyristoyl] glucosamine N-acyltransferase
MVLTVAQLAQRIEAELAGDGSMQITAVESIQAAGQSNITFISDDKHLPDLEKSQAGAVIVARRIESLAKPQLIVKNVNAALIKTLEIFAPKLKGTPPGIDPAAKIGQSVKLGKDVAIGPCVVIDDGVQIGDNTIIAAGCKIGENSTLGKNCRLDSNVVVYHNCSIGSNVIIQANTTIGSTGFGYYFIDGAHRLIPHNGTVVIEDFVEIGANVCIDRAKFGETRICAGTKIDNLVQIAHNVSLGKCCLIASQVGIAGSSKLGNGVVAAGQVGIADHVEIGDGVVVCAQSAVIKNVPAGMQVLGVPAIERRDGLRRAGLQLRLPELFDQVKKLNKRVERLEAPEDNKS